MNWNANHVNITLQSDIHCGDQALGFVSRTFPFVPCHIPFFALVPAAIKSLQMPDVHDSYKKIEKFFFESVRTTPFYIYGSKEKHILFPWDKEDREILEYFYLSSNYGVSLEYQKRSAKDGCLYEVEFIMANRRFELRRSLDTIHPTKLEGAIFFKKYETEEFSLDDDGTLKWKNHTTTIKELCSDIQLGGKRNRSLGHPGIVEFYPWDSKLLWNNYSVSLDKLWPEMSVAENQRGPVPLASSENYAQFISEANEKVLTGRRYTSQGAGLGMEEPAFVLSEGWMHKKTCGLSIKFEHPRYTVIAN